ncbi:baculoviral IAP repeat-containing protein 5.2-A-like isoform X2 [Empidonax traillii]|uniref:baculoviral IAP repeat-containing protein 5.2-A-like isoform X2 n=1 Tax=Empidonax traillii TaxID=164674 RepID=UPI000FFD9F65|nr:baculoviral IAP repeat-containing protein 5.2-A-like isoform X2 [Empidonax traillii]
MAGPAVLPEEWRLYLVSSRVATFRNWPFTEGCACTPERGGTQKALCGLWFSFPSERTC